MSLPQASSCTGTAQGGPISGTSKVRRVSKESRAFKVPWVLKVRSALVERLALLGRRERRARRDPRVTQAFKVLSDRQVLKVRKETMDLAAKEFKTALRLPGNLKADERRKQRMQRFLEDYEG